jgi:cell division protein FtsL
MIELYTEYGITAVVVLLFIGMIKFLQTSLMSKLREIEDISIKLIDRWNRSDESRDRRHEDLSKEIAELSDKISYLSGKINAK